MGFNVTLVPAKLPNAGLPLWLVDCSALFARDGGLCCDGEGRDWGDNDLRFALLCHVGARLAAGQGPTHWRPDVVQANDWHSGLLPLLAREYGSAVLRLFAIHNMAFQGSFPLAVGGSVGLAPQHLTTGGVEFHGRLTFLKAGLRLAEKLVTVSPTYGREITAPKCWFGLEGLVSARAGDLEGILNGADYAIWDPAHDSYPGPLLRHGFRRRGRTGSQGSLRRDRPALARQNRRHGRVLGGCGAPPAGGRRCPTGTGATGDEMGVDGGAAKEAAIRS